MTLVGLTQFLSQLDFLSSLDADPECRRITGLLSAARPAVLASLVHRRSRPSLVLVPHAQQAHDMYTELSEWSDRRVALYPALDSMPYERVRVDRAVVAARQSIAASVARGDVDVVVASVRALMQTIDRPDSAGNSPAAFRTGDRIAIGALLTQLLERGYSEVDLVEEAGTFARRGGVVDVFPAGDDDSVRIEFFGNEIDSMRNFDPVTQRSNSDRTEVTVQPMASLSSSVREQALHELLALDASEMTAEAQTLWLDDLARLEAGASYEDVAALAPYLMHDPCSLIQLFPATADVFVISPDELWGLGDDLCSQSEEILTSLVSAGAVPAGLRDPLLPPADLRQEVMSRSYLELSSSTESAEGSVDWSGLFTPAPVYAGRIRAFEQHIAHRSVPTAIIASQQNERIAELLADSHVALHICPELLVPPESGITLTHSTAAEGWVLPSRSMELITDHEIFGRSLYRPVARKPRKAREAFFTEFSPGDYVVHLEHGIGRFEAVTRMTVEGAEREYAIVQYAGTDRVYVPTDSLERLTRYVGSGDSKPQLSKLGAGEWQRARQRARAGGRRHSPGTDRSVCASRRTREAHAFGPDLPWQHELESSFPYPETPDQLRPWRRSRRIWRCPTPWTAWFAPMWATGKRRWPSVPRLKPSWMAGRWPFLYPRLFWRSSISRPLQNVLPHFRSASKR